MTQSMRQKKTKTRPIKKTLMKRRHQKRTPTAMKKTLKTQKILGKKNHIKTTSKLS